VPHHFKKCIDTVNNSNYCASTSNHDSTRRRGNIKFVLVVALTLLIVAGVEINPGPIDKDSLVYLTAFESRISVIIAGYKNKTIQAVDKVQNDLTKLTEQVTALREDLNSANKKIGELEIKNSELNEKMDEMEN
jgi:peptidoglycan hydrolase CwlO-like protein